MDQERTWQGFRLFVIKKAIQFFDILKARSFLMLNQARKEKLMNLNLIVKKSMSRSPKYKLVSLLFAALLAGCGGGGGSDTPAPSPSPSPGVSPPTENPVDPPTTTPPPATTPPPVPPDSTSMMMSCIDGANFQCSGRSIVSAENGVTLTASGVQVYARSTSDLADPNPDGTTATGLALSSGGSAEVRIAKDSNGAILQAAMLLRNLGLTWDGRTERPQIIETFNPTGGRVELDASGALSFLPLPPSSDLTFYDYAVRGTAGTQENYANNRYFPRDGNPSRCGSTSTTCPDTETIGLKYYQIGDWRTGGTVPDYSDAGRVHGDGDIHAGDALPGSSPPWLAGGTGYGVPFPGSKGYRAIELWSFQYANLSAWVTQDTVNIGEWGALNEHNKNRRGLLAFGAVSDPALVPTTGSATYEGTAYGRYSRNGTEESVSFRGPATVAVNFASREVVVTIANAMTTGATPAPVPVTLQAVTTMGAAGTITANYMTGAVDNGTLRGGLSGRHFGPVVATGVSGQGPAEIGGAFSLSNTTTGAVAIGGFIARKR